jgi:hypothetical protein
MTETQSGAAAPPPDWHFELVDSISHAGQRVNEDRGTALARAAWVLDGATGLGPQRLFPGPSDPAWLAETADHLLRRLTPAIDDGSTLLQRLVAELREEFAAAALAPLHGTDIEPPAASLAAVLLAGSELEVVMLGDCKILLRGPDGHVEAFDQSPVAPFDARVVDALRAAQAAGETELRRIAPRLTALIRENRGRKNRPGGYGVLSDDPAGLAFLAATRRPLAGITHALLATDGFYRLVDTFRTATAEQLFAAARARGLAPLYAELRRLEDADPECLAHPRLKPRDDATALLVCVKRGEGDP